MTGASNSEARKREAEHNTPPLVPSAGVLSEAEMDSLDAVLIALWQVKTELGFNHCRDRIYGTLRPIVAAHVTAAKAEAWRDGFAEAWDEGYSKGAQDMLRSDGAGSPNPYRDGAPR